MLFEAARGITTHTSSCSPSLGYFFPLDASSTVATLCLLIVCLIASAYVLLMLARIFSQLRDTNGQPGVGEVLLSLQVLSPTKRQRVLEHPGCCQLTPRPQSSIFPLHHATGEPQPAAFPAPPCLATSYQPMLKVCILRRCGTGRGRLEFVRDTPGIQFEGLQGRCEFRRLRTPIFHPLCNLCPQSLLILACPLALNRNSAAHNQKAVSKANGARQVSESGKHSAIISYSLP